VFQNCHADNLIGEGNESVFHKVRQCNKQNTKKIDGQAGRHTDKLMKA